MVKDLHQLLGDESKDMMLLTLILCFGFERLDYLIVHICKRSMRISSQSLGSLIVLRKVLFET